MDGSVPATRWDDAAADAAAHAILVLSEMAPGSKHQRLLSFCALPNPPPPTRPPASYPGGWGFRAHPRRSPRRVHAPRADVVDNRAPLGPRLPLEAPEQAEAVPAFSAWAAAALFGDADDAARQAATLLLSTVSRYLARVRAAPKLHGWAASLTCAVLRIFNTPRPPSFALPQAGVARQLQLAGEADAKLRALHALCWRTIHARRAPAEDARQAERRLGAWREVFGACCLMQAACTLARHTERPPGGAEEGGCGATSVPHEGRDAEARAALRLLDLGLIIGGPASKVMNPSPPRLLARPALPLARRDTGFRAFWGRWASA